MDLCLPADFRSNPPPSALHREDQPPPRPRRPLSGLRDWRRPLPAALPAIDAAPTPESGSGDDPAEDGWYPL